MWATAVYAKRSSLLLLAVLLAGPARADWNVRELHPGREMSRNSMALAPSGRLAIAYGDNQLYYAVRSVTGWIVETVDPSCKSGEPRSVSLAFDADGRPAISYQDDDTVKLARGNGSGWDIQSVDSALSVFRGHTHLAFDANGQPAIVYRDFSLNALRIARWDGSSWSSETVDSAGQPGYDCFLAFDAAGSALIAYGASSPDEVRLARWDGAVWDVNVVASEHGEDFSLAVDPADHPAIGYVSDSGLRYAHWDGTSWNVETVDPGSWDIPRHASLAFDAAGNPLLGYLEIFEAFPGGIGWVMLARRDGASWTIETLDMRELQGDCCLVLDASGEPALSFAIYHNPGFGHDTPGEIRVMRRESSAWTSDIVDRASNSMGAAVDVDAIGVPGISHGAYGETRPWEVRLTRRQGVDWTSESVAEATYVGDWTSLAFDSQGQPAIGYLNLASDTDLLAVLATWDGSAWALDVLDGWALHAPSAVFDAWDVPFVALRGYCGAVRIRHGAASDLVDTDNNVASLTSGRGEMLLAYSHCVSPGVKLASYNGASWDVETADPDVERLAGVGISASIDATGEPAISYVVLESPPSPGGRLRLARRQGSVWGVEVLGSSSNILSSSLAFDPDGYPSVSYVADLDGSQRLEFWHGEAGDAELVDTGTSLTQGLRALGYDGDGIPLLAYHSCRSLRIASPTGPATLYRSRPPLAQGWKAAALPLTSMNDEELAPFPVSTASPDAFIDDAPGSDVLVLYRLLWSGDRPARNTLRAVKLDSEVSLSY